MSNRLYGLDAQGTEWLDKTQQIVEQTITPQAADVDEQARFPSESIQALGAAGFGGLCLPAESNGQGQPPRVFAAVVEAIAQGCPSTAMIYVMHVSGSQAIAASKTLKRRDEILAEMSAGRHLTTLAFSERGSRSQFWAPTSQLEHNGSGYITTANKSWITSAHHAHSYVSSGQKPGAESPLESTLYLVDRENPSVNVTGAYNGLGLRGNDSTPVEYNDLVLSEDDMLTSQGAGATAMLEVVLPWFVVGTAAMANGLCRAAVATTSTHLTGAGFEHTGTSLRDLPNLRARLATMNVRTEQSRALLAHTVGLMESPDAETPLFVLQSRLAAIEAAQDVTDLAMKACGGAAFSRRLGLERYFRDARAGWVMAPTSDHLQEFVGRALVGLPLF